MNRDKKEVVGGWLLTNGEMPQRAAAFVIALLYSLWAAAGSTDASQLDQIFRRSTLQIATPDARLHTFDVWIADDEARRARGLMFIEHLDEDAGMLFVYPDSQPIAMWMKNTSVPLDMLFVRADGRIAHVVENTEPMSLDSIESKEPVLAVIELKGGTAAKLKIRPGARVMHPVFGTLTGSHGAHEQSRKR